MDRNSEFMPIWENPKLLCIYADGGEKINPLHGYYQGNERIRRQRLGPYAPEDRKLLLFAALKKNSIEAAFYDVKP